MVHGVEDRSLVYVHPGWWSEPGPPGVDEHFPVAVFDLAVVVAAEQQAVVLVGSTAVDPAENVMGLTPGQRPITTRPRAPPVPDFQRGAGRAGEQPSSPDQVDQIPVLVEEARDDVRVAAQVTGQARGERGPVVQPSCAGRVLQGARRDGDDDPGFDPAGGGQLA